MIEGLRPYAEYRSLENSSFVRIPQHWSIQRLRNLSELFVSSIDKHSLAGEQSVRVCNYVDVYRNERITSDVDFQRATATARETERFRLRLGDVLITKDSEDWEDIGVPSLVQYASADLVCGYHLAILRPRPQSICPDYLFRALQSVPVSQHFRTNAHGVTRFGLSHGAIKDALIPVPSFDEQKSIARFLVYATSRISRFIQVKRRLICLLDEQKRAIINRAVTRGLDSNVPLKDSGVPWIGRMPAHWSLFRFRVLASRIDQGVSPQASPTLAEGGAWGVLKAGCVNGGVFRETQHKRLDASFAVDPSIVVQVGDVLVSRASGSPRLVGSVGRVSALSYNLILSDKTFRPRFNRLLDGGFAVFMMNSGYYRKQVEEALSGADGLANNLPLSALRDFRFAVPPIAEQMRIEEYLRGELQENTQSMERAEREISLIREYRDRLIADVVTGRLDVRSAATLLPAFTAEEGTVVDVADDELALDEDEPEAAA